MVDVGLETPCPDCGLTLVHVFKGDDQWIECSGSETEMGCGFTSCPDCIYQEGTSLLFAVLGCESCDICGKTMGDEL